MGSNMFPDYLIGPEAMKFFEQGYKCQIEGDLKKAVYYYKKSLEIEVTAEAYTFLGWTYSFMGKYEMAIEECRKAIRVDPNFGNPYNDIGSYYISLGKLNDAFPWLEKAKKAKRYASLEFPCVNLGRAYEMKGLLPKAMEEYKEALQINPDYEPAKAALVRLEALLN